MGSCRRRALYRGFSCASRVACGVMGMLLVSFTPPLPRWLEAGLVTRCAWLTAIIGGAIVAYFAALYAVGLRVSEFRMKTSKPPV